MNQGPEPISEWLGARDEMPRARCTVPRLGLGTGALGHLYAAVSEEQAQATLEQAYEAGIRFFDTAPLYGAGLAERRLGRILADKPRSEFVLSTKAGRLVDVEGLDGSWHFDFTYDGIMRSFEASLERLGLDRIDILHLHDPERHVAQATDSGLNALRKLRDEGVIAAIGVGMNNADVLARMAQSTDIDCLLVANRYTLLDRTAERELLPICRRNGIAAIAGGVFNSGLLAAPMAGATFDYQAAPASHVVRAQALAAICERYGVPMKAAALQFPLRHPAVKAVLIGPRSVDELTENIKFANFRLPDALWTDIEASNLPLR